MKWFVSVHLNQMDENISAPLQLSRHIEESDIVDAYLNVEIAQRLYRTHPAANSEWEHSFSVYKSLQRPAKATTMAFECTIGHNSRNECARLFQSTVFATISATFF